MALPAIAAWLAAISHSALDTNHLVQRVHHFDQRALGVHHCVDVLVGHRDLVDHCLVLAALDVGRGAFLVGDREPASGLVAADRGP